MKKTRIRWSREDTELTLLALPTAVWYICFCFLPMFGILIAFKNYRITEPGRSFFYNLLKSETVGFDNFKFLFTGGSMQLVIKLTLLYNIAFQILGILVPVDFLRSHEVPYVECARMGGIPGTPWWLKKDLSGGQAVEQTIHQFDIIRYVFGEPDTVFSMATRGFVKDVEGYDTDDLSSTVIRFKNGALGTISTGCYATEGACFDSKITFSAKDARLDHYIIGKVNIYGDRPAPEDNGDGLVVKGDGTLRAGGDDALTIPDDGTAGVVCDRTFVDAVLTGDGSKIRSPYRDALRSVAFTLACNQSMETGLPVKVELD